MANLNVVLKDEINRIARKVVRPLVQSVKSSSATYRRSIAQLKKDVLTLRRELGALRRSAAASRAESKGPAAEVAAVRFSGRSVVSQRKRLGLSAADFARLLDVTGQTVYNWEKGKRPRSAQVAALGALRSIGRREAQQRLEELRGSDAKRKAGSSRRGSSGRARR